MNADSNPEFSAQEPFKPTGNSPRIWTCFLTLVVVFVAFIFAQILAVIILVGYLMASGVDQEKLPSLMVDESMKPGWFISLGLLGQATIFFGAWIAARLSPEKTTERLRLKSTGLPIWCYGLFAVATIFPTAIGLALAQALTLILPADESALKIWQNLTPATTIAYLLFITIVPGFSEEFLFRGYIQSRLLKRWNPWLAILFSSALFGLLHILPHTVIFAFVVGIWLGFLAWKTDSIWPTIFCHAFINGLWTLLNLAIINFEIPESTQIWMMVVLVVIGLGAFVVSVVMLNRHAKRRAKHLTTPKNSEPKYQVEPPPV